MNENGMCIRRTCEHNIASSNDKHDMIWSILCIHVCMIHIIHKRDDDSCYIWCTWWWLMHVVKCRMVIMSCHDEYAWCGDAYKVCIVYPWYIIICGICNLIEGSTDKCWVAEEFTAKMLSHLVLPLRMLEDNTGKINVLVWLLRSGTRAYQWWFMFGHQRLLAYFTGVISGWYLYRQVSDIRQQSDVAACCQEHWNEHRQMDDYCQIIKGRLNRQRTDTFCLFRKCQMNCSAAFIGVQREAKRSHSRPCQKCFRKSWVLGVEPCIPMERFCINHPCLTKLICLCEQEILIIHGN
jgi:hypothetical protein